MFRTRLFSRALLLASAPGACVALAALGGEARAQAIDLSHGGQITVTALGGFDWDQNAQKVTAYNQAQAVRGDATVTADKLIAYYRKKAQPGAAGTPGSTPTGATSSAAATGAAAPNAAKAATPAGTATTPPPPAPVSPPAAAPTATTAPAASTDAKPTGTGEKTESSGPMDETGSSEIYRLEAIGHVHIFTATDQAWGDKAVYDIDQAVLVMNGHAMKLTTPQDVMTARDTMEYYSTPRISIGRGDATVTTNEGKQVRADVLVGYSAPPDKTAKPATPAHAPAATPAKKNDSEIAGSGKLEKVNAFGHVWVRTQTETIVGDRGVYVPDTGIARVVGNVHITRGDNHLQGAAAIINMHTGLATMTEAPGARVSGLVVPNNSSSGSDNNKNGATKK